jgi:hypothetical protein
MNIIEKVRSMLESFPKIAQICDTVHVDFTGIDTDSYGLASTGDSLLTEDVLGNQTRQHSFMLHSVFSAVNDFERLSNSGVLLELAQHLDSCVGDEVTHEIDGFTHTGEITKISTANGMLSAIPEENTISGWFYQLQITADYTVIMTI